MCLENSKSPRWDGSSSHNKEDQNDPPTVSQSSFHHFIKLLSRCFLFCFHHEGSDSHMIYIYIYTIYSIILFHSKSCKPFIFLSQQQSHNKRNRVLPGEFSAVRAFKTGDCSQLTKEFCLQLPVCFRILRAQKKIIRLIPDTSVKLPGEISRNSRALRRPAARKMNARTLLYELTAFA